MSKPNAKELEQIINRIININHKIYSLSLDEKENYFYDNHPELMKDYPFIIYQICSGKDLSIFNHMLNELRKIENGEKSREQVDVEMGEMLATKYVTPIINKLNETTDSIDEKKHTD